MTAARISGEDQGRTELLLRAEPTEVIEGRVAKLAAGTRVSWFVAGFAALATLFVNLRATWGTVNGFVEGSIGPMSVVLAMLLVEFTPTYRSWPSRLALAVSISAVALGFSLSYEHFLELIEADSFGAYMGAATPDVLAGVALFKSLEMRSLGARDRAELARRKAATKEAEAEREAAAQQAQVQAIEAERRAEEEARAAAEAEELEHRRALELERARERAAATELNAMAASSGVGANSNEAAIAAYLIANAGERSGRGPTQRAVAEALGINARTVGRSTAWKNHAAASARTEVSELAPAANMAAGVGTTTNNGTAPTPGEDGR